MFFDDVTKKSHCFLDIRIVELFELLNENIQHRDGNLGLLSLISIDVCVFSLLLCLEILLAYVIQLVDLFLDDVLY